MSLTILNLRFWPDNHGGVEQHMWRLATHAAMHVGVEVLCENRLDIAPCEEPQTNLTIHRGDKINYGRLWRWPYIPRLRWWIGQLRKHPPQGWIWAIDPPAATAAIMLGHADRLIYNPPGCWEAMNRTWLAHRHIDTMKIAKGFRVLERFAYRRAAKVIVASKSIGRQYAQFHGTRQNVHVVPRGADRELIQALPSRTGARQLLGLPEHAFVVGFVGRLDPCKDLPHLIRACARPDVISKDDRLLLVGTGPDQRRVTEAVMQMGMADRIVLAGNCAGEKLHAAYAAMDAFVLPSLYEGYGMVVLEAMAAAVPVVGRPGDGVSSFTSMAEMIEPGWTGLLMDPHRVEDLAAKLRWLKRNPDRAQRLGENGRQSLRNRPWSAVIADYLNILGLTDTTAALPDRMAA